MNDIYTIFGNGGDLTIWQMSARSFAMFFISLFLIRVGGARMFGKRSSFDDIIVIMLGAILSRGVVGANPFWATVAASAVMIAIHRSLAWICIKSKYLETIIKGKSTILYEHNQINYINMEKYSLSKTDLLQSLHLETKKNTLDDIETAFIETNGRISFIMKKTKDL